jgi:hypothetical protein
MQVTQRKISLPGPHLGKRAISDHGCSIEKRHIATCITLILNKVLCANDIYQSERSLRKRASCFWPA